MTPAGIPSGLESLPWELPHTFLGLDEAGSDFARAAAVILPVPYESTTSYGGGTRAGPGAIVEASRYIELYDQELDCEAGALLGIHTLPALELTRAGATPAMRELHDAYAKVADVCGDRFLMMLGGEHSVSSPAILAQAERRPERISVLQLDAHADLRAEYEGTPHSHACVMHTVHDRVRIVQAGIRSLTAEERALQRRKRMTVVFGHELESPDWEDRVLEALGPDVYLTIDVDYFDPAIMPSTGTPEPGGGQWSPTIRLLDRLFRERRVVGADVVELAPLPGIVAPDFLAAKLVYKLIGFHARARRS